MSFPAPTLRELREARKAFEDNEPRDLFYRAATDLVSRAIDRKSKLKVAEALAVLLQTWNQAYYRFRPFDSQHFSDIESLTRRNRRSLATFRKRFIKDLNNKDEKEIKNLFKEFEIVLGPVGASKSLHLLAPRFFPLWDRIIAEAYGLALKKRGENADQYYSFMEISKEQCKSIGRKGLRKQNTLKVLDEYNYCKFTRKWI